MKQKLKIENLKVKSFLTRTDNHQDLLLKGGCSAFGGTGLCCAMTADPPESCFPC